MDCTVDLSPILLHFSEPVLAVLLVFLIGETYSNLGHTTTVEYRRIVGRLISKVTLFKPSIFVSSYGTELMFSFVVWFNMCGDRSHFLFTKFSFNETY